MLSVRKPSKEIKNHSVELKRSSLANRGEDDFRNSLIFNGLRILVALNFAQLEHRFSDSLARPLRGRFAHFGANHFTINVCQKELHYDLGCASGGLADSVLNISYGQKFRYLDVKFARLRMTAAQRPAFARRRGVGQWRSRVNRPAAFIKRVVPGRRSIRPILTGTRKSLLCCA